MKVIFCFVLVVTLASGQYRRFGQLDSFQSNEPAKYSFNYGVSDPFSGNNFGHQETRNDDLTQGSYSVLLPDGRTQTVTYYVDGDSGFVADVSYDNEPPVRHGGQESLRGQQQSLRHRQPFVNHRQSFVSQNQPSPIQVQSFLRQRQPLGIQGQSFINRNQPFGNHGQSFVNQGQSFVNQRQTFGNQGQNFVSHRQPYVNQGQSFVSQNQPFVNHEQSLHFGSP